jgi:hypothetical protein
MTSASFPLRLHDTDRDLGRRVASKLHVSENRLYAELIHDGLLMREQLLYMDRLRVIAAATRPEDALKILEKAADDAPAASDWRQSLDFRTGAT